MHQLAGTAHSRARIMAAPLEEHSALPAQQAQNLDQALAYLPCTFFQQPVGLCAIRMLTGLLLVT
jgi:hypothetical protein